MDPQVEYKVLVEARAEAYALDMNAVIERIAYRLGFRDTEQFKKDAWEHYEKKIRPQLQVTDEKGRLTV